MPKAKSSTPSVRSAMRRFMRHYNQLALATTILKSDSVESAFPDFLGDAMTWSETNFLVYKQEGESALEWLMAEHDSLFDEFRRAILARGRGNVLTDRSNDK